MTFNVTYLFTEHWGIELLAALPFKHDIKLKGSGEKVATTKQLPPTLSLQYHFSPVWVFRPYVGAGLNYTKFFRETTTGALAGTDLHLSGSLGPAAQAGFDIPLYGELMLNVDVRWIDIETDAKVDGVFLESVDIDPLTAGASLSWMF